MKLIDDTLKENGAWSKAYLMILVTFISNIVYAGWCVWKTAVFVDLPTNWLGLIVVLYGINKTASVATAINAVPGTTTVNKTETRVTT